MAANQLDKTQLQKANNTKISSSKPIIQFYSRNPTQPITRRPLLPPPFPLLQNPTLLLQTPTPLQQNFPLSLPGKLLDPLPDLLSQLFHLLSQLQHLPPGLCGLDTRVLVLRRRIIKISGFGFEGFGKPIEFGL